MRKLIVGVDPGVTVGLAVLSLDGKLISVRSRRGWSISEIVKVISELGEPTIISSDVSPPSGMLEHLSHKLNAVLFAPPISMGADEKRQIAREYADLYGLRLENNHEADALAAAVKAYKHYEKKFKHIDAYVRRTSLKISVDDVKDLVVRGYSMKRAIQHLQGIDKYRPPPVTRRHTPKEEQLKSLVEELQRRLTKERERVKHLQRTNLKLKTHIKTLEKEILTLKEMIREIRNKQKIEVRREREYALLMDELEKARAKAKKYFMKLEEYKHRLNDMQRLRDLESRGRLTLLKPIESFTDRGLQKAFKIYGIKAGDFVLLLDPSGGGAATAEELARRGVKVVVTKGRMSHNALDIFEKYMIPIINYENLKVEWIEGLPYADPKDLRERLRMMEKKEALAAYRQFKEMLEDHRREALRDS